MPCNRHPSFLLPPPGIPLLVTTNDQTGIYGYVAYSASKFALVGMAQALQMEVSKVVEAVVSLWHIARGGAGDQVGLPRMKLVPKFCF